VDTTFCGLSLSTAPGRVMVPRPASEQLVAAARRIVGDRPARVVVVGTGSGALAIAIAAAAPNALVWGTDTSPDAVTVAIENVRRHGLANRIDVCHGDLLEPVPGAFDLVVANLPYLPAAEAPLHPELAAEPAAAVYAPGDGLGPYRRLLAACARRLSPDGAVAIQLHRRVLTASRAELAKLYEALDPALAAA
jgi:release factor glutamine methyltransferase